MNQVTRALIGAVASLGFGFGEGAYHAPDRSSLPKTPAIGEREPGELVHANAVWCPTGCDAIVKRVWAGMPNGSLKRRYVHIDGTLHSCPVEINESRRSAREKRKQVVASDREAAAKARAEKAKAAA